MDRCFERWLRITILLALAGGGGVRCLRAQGGELDLSFWDAGIYEGPPSSMRLDTREDGLLAGCDGDHLAFLIDDHAGGGWNLPDGLLPRAVAAQPGGRILVVADNPIGESTSKIELFRLLRDLTLDPTFAGGGRVVVAQTSYDNLEPYQVTTAPDGSIFLLWSSFGGLAVDKRRPDGTAIVGDAFPARVEAVATSSPSPALLVQPDGKPVVAGAGGGSPGSWVVARFTSAGTPDASFGSAGVATVQLDDSVGLSGAGLAADGGLYLAGTASYGTGSSSFGLLGKLDGAGALDDEFGTGGLRPFSLGTSATRVGALLVVPGFPEWLLVGGSDGGSYGFPSADAVLMAFDARGDVRGEFGDGGRATLALPTIPATPDQDHVVGLTPQGERLDRVVVVLRHPPYDDFSQPPTFRAARVFLY